MRETAVTQIVYRFITEKLKEKLKEIPRESHTFLFGGIQTIEQLFFKFKKSVVHESDSLSRNSP